MSRHQGRFDPERYARQLPLIGEEGQRRLAETALLVAGAGGLGTVIAQYCAYAGFGTLRIADCDRVERHNLNRQVFYREEDVGRLKAEVCAERIAEANPAVEVEPCACRIERDTIGHLLHGIDIVLDGMDNYAARYLLNDAAFETNIPYVHGAVSGYYGQVTTILPGISPCLRCLVPSPPEEGELPVLGPTAGVIGCIEATEALKIVLRSGRLLTGRLLLWNGLEGEAEVIQVRGNPECRRCGGGQADR